MKSENSALSHRAPDGGRRGEGLLALVDEVLEDGTPGGDARGDADLAERRVDAGGHAGAPRLHDADGGRRERGVDHADADAGDRQAGQQAVQSSDGSSPLMSSRPPPTSSRPTPMNQRMPTLSASLPEIGATKNESSVVGRKRSPASSAL